MGGVLTSRVVLAKPLPATTAASGLSADACLMTVALVALLPSALLLVMVSCAAPLEPTWSAGLATAAGASLAAAGTFFHCLNVEPMHALVSHVMPVVFFAFSGALAGSLAPQRAGKRALGTPRWWRRDFSTRGSRAL